MSQRAAITSVDPAVSDSNGITEGDEWQHRQRRRMPNIHRAFIEPAKLREYLLSPAHPTGQSKAAFFFSLGYSLHRWHVLDADLRSQHLVRLASERHDTAHGCKFVVRASLHGPVRRAPLVVSVWIVLAGEDFPRFVTAYPGD